MARLNWNSTGKRFYENGIDHGVLYIPGVLPAVWNGLVSVSLEGNGDNKQFYIDGYNYLNLARPAAVKGTITAFNSPAAFDVCDGSLALASGFHVHNQMRKPFSISYRTMIANNFETLGYNIHILTNVLAAPSERVYKTLTDDGVIDALSWDILARPTRIAGANPTAHVTIDTRYITAGALEEVENILYGTEDSDPKVPDLVEIADIIRSYESAPLVDNHDGTFSMHLRNSQVKMISDTQFEVQWQNAGEMINSTTYTISDEE